MNIFSEFFVTVFTVIWVSRVEFNRLQEVTTLEELLFVGNPLCEAMEESVWKIEASKRLPFLKKLDGEPVVREEPPSAEQ